MANTTSAKKNIYLFHGPDNFSATQKLTHWKKEFEKKYGDLNIQAFNGKDLTAGSFKEATETLPFLGEKRLVIIEDFLRDANEENRTLIAENLENVPEHCVLVFIEREKADARTVLYKKLAKIGHATPFEDRDLPELINWINAESARKNLRIGRRETVMLAEHVGTDLWQMSQEIEKLALYGATAPVDEKAIENLTSQNISASIFNLTDSIAQKAGRPALKTLDDLTLSGTPLMQVFHMIVRHFRILIQIRAHLAKKTVKAKIASELKISSYIIDKIISQAKGFSDEQLARIYRELLQIEIDGKSNRIRITTADQTELRLSIEKLIVALCV